MQPTNLLAIATESVLNALRYISFIEASGEFRPVSKSDRSPVTCADLSSQLGICKVLAETCPEIPVIAEEESGTLHSDAFDGHRQRFRSVLDAHLGFDHLDQYAALLDHGRTANVNSEKGAWVLDPIDGTKGYLRRAQYAVALGYIVNGQPEFGVLACPRLKTKWGTGCLIFGRRGHGAWLTALDTPDISHDITVASATDPSHWTMCESVEAAHTDHHEAGRIAAMLNIERPPLRMDSQCKYAAVAMGMATYYLRFPRTPGRSEKIWDHAAGQIIVEAAGGRVTDADGRGIDYTLGHELKGNRGMVVSQGGDAHEAVLEAIETLGI